MFKILPIPHLLQEQKGLEQEAGPPPGSSRALPDFIDYFFSFKLSFLSPSPASTLHFYKDQGTGWSKTFPQSIQNCDYIPAMTYLKVDTGIGRQRLGWFLSPGQIHRKVEPANLPPAHSSHTCMASPHVCPRSLSTSD